MAPIEPGRISSRRAYTGRVISLDVDTVRFPDGNTGELEVVRHPGASAIIPIATIPHGNTRRSSLMNRLPSSQPAV